TRHPPRPPLFPYTTLFRSQNQPGSPRRAAPPATGRVDAPGPDHAEVRVEDQTRVEAQKQVLAVRLHAFHHLTRQPLGPAVERERSEEHTSELQSLAYLVCR